MATAAAGRNLNSRNTQAVSPVCACITCFTLLYLLTCITDFYVHDVRDVRCVDLVLTYGAMEEVRMAKQAKILATETDLAKAAGQAAKAKRAARRAADRLKKKAKPQYCTRVLSAYKDSDSTTAKFMQSALAVKHASTEMKAKMRTTFVALQAFAQLARWGKKVDPVSLTFKQFRGYIQSRIGKVTARTLQNEASHVRRALRSVGRGEFAAVTCASERLGVPRSSRIGTRTAVHSNVYETALAQAREDTKAILRLEHAIGLRHREAVQVDKSLLLEWKRAIENGQPLYVREKGPKGGRPRFVRLSPSKARDAVPAIDAAIKVLETQEFLCDSVNLKAALGTNHERMQKIGIAGDDAQQSIRINFSVEQYDYYRCELQMPEKEAWATVCNDLGHGDKRGRWAYNCYLKATLEQREAALAAAAAAAAEQDGKAA